MGDLSCEPLLKAEDDARFPNRRPFTVRRQHRSKPHLSGEVVIDSRDRTEPIVT